MVYAAILGVGVGHAHFRVSVSVVVDASVDELVVMAVYHHA